LVATPKVRATGSDQEVELVVIPFGELGPRRDELSLAVLAAESASTRAKMLQPTGKR